MKTREIRWTPPVRPSSHLQQMPSGLAEKLEVSEQPRDNPQQWTPNAWGGAVLPDERDYPCLCENRRAEFEVGDPVELPTEGGCRGIAAGHPDKRRIRLSATGRSQDRSTLRAEIPDHRSAFRHVEPQRRGIRVIQRHRPSGCQPVDKRRRVTGRQVDSNEPVIPFQQAQLLNCVGVDPQADRAGWELLRNSATKLIGWSKEDVDAMASFVVLAMDRYPRLRTAVMARLMEEPHR